jgi:predicted TIM-barrel fold metal-dependent hydrolase
MALPNGLFGAMAGKTSLPTIEAAPARARRTIACALPNRARFRCACPEEISKQIYFDSLVFTPEAMRHLVAQVGASQVVLGSDTPYPFQLQPVDHVFASESLSDDHKADILGRTAARLLNFTA